MKIKIFTSLLFVSFFGSLKVFAADDAQFTATFEAYKNNVTQYCDNTNQSWSKKNALVPIPQYAPLRIENINAQIEKAKKATNFFDNDKKRLQFQLAEGSISQFTGLKVVEVARNQYRTAMNRVFSCSVIDARLQIIGNMRKTVEQKTKSKNSEIKEKLNKIQKKLEKSQDKLQCNPSKKNEIASQKELINTATRQYCHYRYYLSYVEENFLENKRAIDTLEGQIGQKDKKNIKYPQTLDSWRKSFNRQSNTITNEINRADQSLPRAIREYQNMQYSYPIHIMLTIIYDDYIRLRNNLSKYMNASSQLYQKAYNAQDKNER
ncbi:hypothetical protein KGV55_00545 [Candidatus Gracilibacteria bacterium]|nr:hypothetical protein [Candidatus Gracilibacteria bacterium]